MSTNNYIETRLFDISNLNHISIQLLDDIPFHMEVASYRVPSRDSFTNKKVHLVVASRLNLADKYTDQTNNVLILEARKVTIQEAGLRAKHVVIIADEIIVSGPLECKTLVTVCNKIEWICSNLCFYVNSTFR